MVHRPSARLLLPHLPTRARDTRRPAARLRPPARSDAARGGRRPWAPEDVATEQRPEPVTSEVGHAAYRFAVHADEADGADDPVSAWRFYWNQDKGATDACAGLTVHLAVAAIKG